MNREGLPANDPPTVVSRTVGRGRAVGVRAEGPDADLDGPLYAVNLLELSRPRLYDLYGALTFPLARRVGARVLFKGARTEVLRGPDAVGRVLLIVAYPDAASFLRLATRPSFALLSLLRRAALSRFRFAFYHRLDAGPEPAARPRSYRGADYYLLRGYEEAGDGQAGAGSGEPFFHGVRVATVVARSGDDHPWRPTKLAPAAPWGRVSLHAGDAASLRSTPGDGDAAYQALYRRHL